MNRKKSGVTCHMNLAGFERGRCVRSGNKQQSSIERRKNNNKQLHFISV